MTMQSRSLESTAPAMSIRRAAFAAAFGLIAGFAASAAPQAQAQEAMQAPPRAIGMPPSPDKKIPTLGCCRCLGGQNKLDLSTIPGNPWLVNGQPAVAVTQPNAAWAPPGSAKWVSINAAAHGGNNTTHHYTLQFKVEKCTIPQTIVFKGLSAAGDNYLKISLTGPSGGSAQCTMAGGYCFRAPYLLNNFATSWPGITTPGLYTLNVDVTNISGPTGMFVNAVLEGQCTKELVKPGKGQDI
ncbi:MAG: hypothetical protein V4673_19245 [Pseudomonadota bacterium]